MKILIFGFIGLVSCGNYFEENQEDRKIEPEKQVDYSVIYEEIVLKYFENPPGYFEVFFKSNQHLGIPIDFRFRGDDDSDKTYYHYVPDKVLNLVKIKWEESVQAAFQNSLKGDCVGCQLNLVRIGLIAGMDIMYMHVSILSKNFDSAEKESLMDLIDSEFEEHINLGVEILERENSLENVQSFSSTINKAFDDAWESD